MKEKVRDLIAQGNRLFSRRSPLMSLWQTTAENFYPERADFIRTFSLGDEFAANLMTGAPVLARRDLANNFHAMLRPREKPWFHPRTLDDRINEDAGALKWLDWAGERMRRVMYDRRAQFVRATSEGDHDFASFGQCVIQPTENRDRDGLLYRTWHLRDCVWCENSALEIDVFHRNWKLEARELVRLFPKTVDPKVTKGAEKEPYLEIKCRHIVVPADQYSYSDAEKKPKRGFPFVSIYIDLENETILEETPAASLGYVIPRWQTVSGSQYAYSPATVVALPDARLIQQITLTLLESGQKAVDPPMVGVAEAIAGGANLYAGGITWADAEYDERLGEVLRPVFDKHDAINWGVEREERIQKAIHAAFYLDQINMPYPDAKMTATEYRGRIEEYIRRALPLFEPMETEYNGALCNETFDLNMRMGLFGAPQDIPPILLGQDIRFTFDSPLQSATDRAKAEGIVAAAQLLAAVAQYEPTASVNVDWNGAFRDALPSVGLGAKFIVDEKQAAQARQGAQQAQQMHAMADMVGKGAGIAENVGTAAQSLQQAGLV